MDAATAGGGDELRSGVSEGAEVGAGEQESEGKVRGGVGRLRGVRGRQEVASRRWPRSAARSPRTCFSFWQKVEEAGSAGWAGPANWAARWPGQVGCQVSGPGKSFSLSLFLILFLFSIYFDLF